MPAYPLWMARLIARETWMFATALGLVVIILGTSHLVRALALTAAVFGISGLIAAWPVYTMVHGRFSLTEYLRGLPSAEIRVQRDLQLVPSRPDLRLDFYEGQGEGARPLIIVIHGGSWQRGDKGQLDHVSKAFAVAGYSVADIQYRLAPAHRFPAPVGDVKCLAGMLRAEAERLRIDPGRIALLGRSAGGHLAALVGYAKDDPKLPSACPLPKGEADVAAVIAVYPAIQLKDAYVSPPRPDLLDTRDTLEKFLGGSPDQAPEVYKLATPTTFVDESAGKRRLPPTLIIHGADDQLVPVYHAQRLYEHLVAASQTVTFISVPRADHGFDFRAGGVGEQLARAAVLDFLRR